MNIQDADILKALSKSKDEAFKLLAEKYHKKIYWFIRKSIYNHQDAEDISQNTFIKIWKNLYSFRKESKLSTWFYRIAINETVNYIKKNKKNILIHEEKSNERLQNLKAEPFIDAQKITYLLHQAINKLPGKQRWVFQLRYFETLPYQEIASITKTTESTCKSSYHFAVKKIEKELLHLNYSPF